MVPRLLSVRATDIWAFAGRVLDAVDRALPRSEVRMTPTEYPMCSRAFSLDVRRDWRPPEWGEPPLLCLSTSRT